MTVQHSIDQKWVYLFEEGTAEMRDLLGGKGAGLCQYLLNILRLSLLICGA